MGVGQGVAVESRALPWLFGVSRQLRHHLLLVGRRAVAFPQLGLGPGRGVRRVWPAELGHVPPQALPPARRRLLGPLLQVLEHQGPVREVLLVLLLVGDLRALQGRDPDSLLGRHVVEAQAGGVWQLLLLHQEREGPVHALRLQLLHPQRGGGREGRLGPVGHRDQLAEAPEGLLYPVQPLGEVILGYLPWQLGQIVAVAASGGRAEVEAVQLSKLLQEALAELLQQRLDGAHDLLLLHGHIARLGNGLLAGPQPLAHGAQRVLPGHVPLLAAPLALGLLGDAVAARVLEGLDLAVHVVRVGEQRVVPALQIHEDLHDLRDVGDVGGVLDGREGLLEDGDRLLVLLDVPPLDAVQEGGFHDSPDHGRLRPSALLLGHDELPLLLHAVLGLLQLDLDLLLLEVVLLQVLADAEDLVLEARPLHLPLLLHHRDALPAGVDDALAGGRLLDDVAQLRGPPADLALHPLEDALYLAAVLPDLVDPLPQHLVVGPHGAEPLRAQVEPRDERPHRHVLLHVALFGIRRRQLVAAEDTCLTTTCLTTEASAAVLRRLCLLVAGFLRDGPAVAGGRPEVEGLRLRIASPQGRVPLLVGAARHLVLLAELLEPPLLELQAAGHDLDVVVHALHAGLHGGSAAGARRGDPAPAAGPHRGSP
mmetsp:Transcript_30678/g.91051  ORF Transcript_30678/g.91051 Transcript_30678/m.91051 type:complete len:651 (+) Transcript_30678:590-2542(+)